MRAMDVADLIRGKNVDQALNILKFTPKKASLIISKVLRSAISNATKKDKDVKVEDLVVLDARIGQGPVLKRFHTRARGRSDMVKRRTSHIYIGLGERQ